MLREQFISQYLLYSNSPWIIPELFYWHREEKGSSSEADFPAPCGKNVIPVEFKAVRTGSLRSFHALLAPKKIMTALSFSGYTLSAVNIKTSIEHPGQADYKLISLPLYMTGQFRRILQAVDSAS